jgi:hypothetical protein
MRLVSAQDEIPPRKPQFPQPPYTVELIVHRGRRQYRLNRDDINQVDAFVRQLEAAR